MENFRLLAPRPYDIKNLMDDLGNYRISAVSNLNKFTKEELEKPVMIEGKKKPQYPIFAALGSDEQAFDEMIRMGISIHSVDVDGNNLFMSVVRSGNYNWLDKIASLKENGEKMDINKPNKKGEYPVHAAAKRMFRRDFVTKLIDLGADFTMKDAEGKTARDILTIDLKDTDVISTKRDFREMYPNCSNEELNTRLYTELKSVIKLVREAEKKNMSSSHSRFPGFLKFLG